MVDSQKIASQNIRIQQWVAILAIALFGFKFAAYFLTRSMAIYTDMLESLVNILAGFFGLYSLYFAARPRDTTHPYGHGKIEFISAIIEGVFIFFAGASILYKVASEWSNPSALDKLDTGILLILITAVLNYMMGFYVIKKGNTNQSPALVASGHHLQTDTYSTIGIVIGLWAVQLSGYMLLDKIIAGLFAFWIMYTGIRIIRDSVGGIMDQADPELIGEIQNYLHAHKRDTWIDIHDMRAIRYGRSIHVDMHITVPNNLTVLESHNEHHIIKALLKQKYGDDIGLIIHFDPGECTGPLV